jgi:hypothetical protein
MLDIEQLNASSLEQIRELALTNAEKDLSFNHMGELLILAKKVSVYLGFYEGFLKENAANELDKETECNGFKISVGGGGRWDYKGCGDPLLDRFVQQVKNRESHLRSQKGREEITDELTGEIVKVFPAAYRSFDRITITEIK